MWATITLLTQAPTYFRMALGWNIAETGLVSGLPHFFRIICSYCLGKFADYMLTTNRLSRTNVRKMGVFVTNIGTGIFIVGLAFSGCNSMVAICCLLFSVTFTGAISTGSLSCFVDLSPNFSSITLGMGLMIGSFSGILSQLTVGWLAFGNVCLTKQDYYNRIFFKIIFFFLFHRNLLNNGNVYF